MPSLNLMIFTWNTTPKLDRQLLRLHVTNSVLNGGYSYCSGLRTIQPSLVNLRVVKNKVSMRNKWQRTGTDSKGYERRCRLRSTIDTSRHARGWRKRTSDPTTGDLLPFPIPPPRHQPQETAWWTVGGLFPAAPLLLLLLLLLLFSTDHPRITYFTLHRKEPLNTDFLPRLLGARQSLPRQSQGFYIHCLPQALKSLSLF